MERELPGHNELATEFLVLKRMMEQLPAALRDLFLLQLNKVVAILDKRDRTFCAKTTDTIDDVILAIKAQEFDLDATRNERNALRDQLDQQ